MATDIGRRRFIAALGGASVAWPLAVGAGQVGIPVVGFLHTLSFENVPHFVPALRQGLKEAGFVEGQNVAVEYRWAEGKYDRLPELAADLVRQKVAVIVAGGSEPTPQIVEAATQTIPIVFVANGDPVREGLVADLSRPGGNATGLTIFGADAVTKRLQLLHELVPRATTIAFLMNPGNPNGDVEMSAALAAAAALGLQMQIHKAADDGGLEAAFAAMADHRPGALLVASDTFFGGRRATMVSQVARLEIPAIYFVREFAQAGGLMSYGNSIPDVYRQAGLYVGRILKGEKPADLPVIQAAKFEFVINLKTAKGLGLAVPNTLLVAADETIE